MREGRSTLSSCGVGEEYVHMDHREHQTRMDTGVKGDKGWIKLL